MLFEHEQKRAVISACGLYRYRLDREWATNGRRVLFVMLNPSTADAERDDNTLRRCKAFARSWDYSSLQVVNLYALRSTDPKVLRCHPDPVGPENDLYIKFAATQAALIVCAWGNNAEPQRAAQVLTMLRQYKLFCLGKTKTDQPLHPLRLSALTALVEL